MQDELDRVVPLDELDDYTVAEGDPDVRGWDVLSADGRKIGEVDNLLVDTGAMKVRYLEVEVDREILQGSGDRHILVPIGYARLHEEDDQVLVDTLNSSDVMGLPEYHQAPLTREYESSVRERFDRGFTGAGPTGAGAEFYAGKGYDEEEFYRTRRTTERPATERTRTDVPSERGERFEAHRRPQPGEVEIDSSSTGRESGEMSATTRARESGDGSPALRDEAIEHRDELSSRPRTAADAGIGPEAKPEHLGRREDDLSMGAHPREHTEGEVHRELRGDRSVEPHERQGEMGAQPRRQTEGDVHRRLPEEGGTGRER